MVLLSLSGFVKKTQKTPPAGLDLAERRLVDWRMRGMERSAGSHRVTAMASPDFLDEMIAESTARNPNFPQLMKEAAVRRKEARRLAAAQEKRGCLKTKWPPA